ncbi:MAG: S8 family serine peptidase [Owenweeksia sp.]|nr:S8 family serine peptidase [Owenweeksia sp.]
MKAKLQVTRAIPTGNREEGRTYVLHYEKDYEVMEVVEMLDQTGIFEFTEPNYVGYGGGQRGVAVSSIPNDSYFSRQWGLYNDGSFSLASATNDADVDMELAWDIEQGSAGVTIAVLDAGTNLGHPELVGRLWTNPNDPTNNGVDDDGNGFKDDFQGWDFANNDNDPSDDNGHGTNVLGIIGANANNNLGYAGVDWHCKLMTCKVLNSSNQGFYTWWVDGIYYAVDEGADIINMSLGGSTTSTLLQSAIDYAYNNGVTVVACMMNEDNNVTYYPAGYANTIAVGALDPDNTRSDPFFWSATSGSNYGNHIDVVAPGNFTYGLHYSNNSLLQ